MKAHYSLFNLFLLCYLFLSLTSCSENIDDANFAIKTEQTIADFISQRPEYSEITKLFKRVKLNTQEGASTLYSTLTARGNYTVFLPNNEAIDTFLEKLQVSSIDELDDYNANLIATSCIIDNLDKSAYSTSLFPNTGTFDQPNLNDRLINCKLTDNSQYIVNNNSKVIDEDNKLSNGYIHGVDKVIAPSNKKIAELIAVTDNTQVFSTLLQKTTWDDSLYLYKDENYEDPNRPDHLFHNDFIGNWATPKHRYQGYTILLEVDSIYEKEFGFKAEYDNNGSLVNSEKFLKKVEDLASKVYGTSNMGDYSHPDNPVNRYVAYHILEGKIAYNRFVHHFNEYGYKIGDPKNPQTSSMPTNVWDFYTSMGKHRSLMLLTQVGDTGFEHDMEHKMYVNRMSIYADGPEDDYREIGVEPGYGGILISSANGERDNNAKNGFYYTLDNLLLCTDGLRSHMYNRRLRIEYSTIFPEIFSNNLRGTYHRSFDHGYLTNVIRESPTTQINYAMQQGCYGFSDFHGDGIHVAGMYDVTIKLPPVPKDGVYEIRMGVAHNPGRGMCQMYFGEDPNKLLPTGLPYDMRQYAEPNNPALPWKPDTEDWGINAQQDKDLRNQGYLKGPKYITSTNGLGNNPVRNRSGMYGVVRRIVLTADMKADRTYYMRYKTALKGTDFMMILDYFEYASTAVYNGPKPEDIW